MPARADLAYRILYHIKSPEAHQNAIFPKGFGVILTGLKFSAGEFSLKSTVKDIQPAENFLLGESLSPTVYWKQDQLKHRKKSAEFFYAVNHKCTNVFELMFHITIVDKNTRKSNYNKLDSWLHKLRRLQRGQISLESDRIETVVAKYLYALVLGAESNFLG